MLSYLSSLIIPMMAFAAVGCGGDRIAISGSIDVESEDSDLNEAMATCPDIDSNIFDLSPEDIKKIKEWAYSINWSAIDTDYFKLNWEDYGRIVMGEVVGVTHEHLREALLIHPSTYPRLYQSLGATVRLMMATGDEERSLCLFFLLDRLCDPIKIVRIVANNALSQYFADRSTGNDSEMDEMYIIVEDRSEISYSIYGSESFGHGPN